MKPAEAIKEWNPKLYYEMLAWKDNNMKKFRQLSKSDSMSECTTAELAALIIILTNDVVDKYRRTKNPHNI